MKILFEDDEKAFLNLCKIIAKVIEENEKFNSQKF